MSDYIKKNTFFSKLGVILSAGLLLLGLNHSVAQDAACEKFKAQYPQYDMSNKGKDCADGRGTFGYYGSTNVINKVHRKTGAPYAFLHSCLNPDRSSQISILVCKSKCTLKCDNAFQTGMESGALSREARKKHRTEYENCSDKCPPL